MPTVVITRPVGGAASSSGVPGEAIGGITIPPLTTLVVDSYDATSRPAVKWIYTIIDATDEEVLTGEVVANQRFGNNPQWNRYALVGDLMQHNVEVQLSGNNLQLLITNNNLTNTYTANIVRIEATA